MQSALRRSLEFCETRPVSAAKSDAQNKSSGVDKLYVLDCGVGRSKDQGAGWTNEVNAGKPIDISVSCYLIHHAQGYFLWDTGVSDAVAAMPDGWLPGNNPNGILWKRARTLASQLAQIGVKPSDVHFIGISHTHPDHIGNAELFPEVPILMQADEYDFYFAPGKQGVAIPPGDTRPSLSKQHPIRKLQGDADVFGDGSVMLLYAPGHTPGHQVCLVHLPKTGWVVLSGDVVHLQTNWDNRRIPHFAGMPLEMRLATLASMQRVADIMSFYHAQLWINHEKTQSDKQKHAPEFYN